MPFCEKGAVRIHYEEVVPVGFRNESNPMYDNSMQTWGPALIKQRPNLTMDMIDKFLTRMYVTNADFVFSVPRDVVREKIPLAVRHVRTFLKANRPV